jgi:NADH dehydrogenase
MLYPTIPPKLPVAEQNLRMTHTESTTHGAVPRPHVVIIGAGFAGMNAAKALRKAPVDVTIIDRNNYHKFQPLLYEVAMAGLEPDDIAHNVREIFRGARNVRFRMGTVEAIDADAQQLALRDGATVAYDYLILAAGAVTNYFGVEGADQHAFPLKNLSDAVELRNHVLQQFELYDRDPAQAPDGRLTFVLVGGGPTGVEMAGALVELFDTLDDDYPAFNATERAQVILLEMQEDLLPPYAKSLRDYTRQTLEDRGVDVRTQSTVQRVEPDQVVLADGTLIPTRTLVWAAGVQASPLAEMVDAEQTRGGQVIVEDDLSLPDHATVFIAGDMAAIEGEADRWLPQLAQVAIQSGRHAAKQIQRRIDGQPTEAFGYTDLGQMATIGRNAAVAELAGGLKVKGLIAWLMWVVIHIAKLVGFRNRASVFMDWIYNYFTYERHARLILNLDGSSDRDAGPLVDVQQASSGDQLPAPVRPTPEQRAAESNG